MLPSLQVAAVPQIPHHLLRRVAVLTALALLIAQWGAMAHAYSHVSRMSLVSGAGSSSHITTRSTHEVCNDCVNFAPLLIASGAPAVLPFADAHAGSLDVRAARSSLLNRPPRPAFRSRAPPDTHRFG